MVYFTRLFQYGTLLPWILIFINLCPSQGLNTINPHEPSAAQHPYSFSKIELLEKRNEVRDLINFALDSYLEFGWPFDEVRPISCVPNTRNWDEPNDINKNDVLGNFTITLFDSLTTIAIMGDTKRFNDMIHLIDNTYAPMNYSFDTNVTIQIFETTIRVLGSLLSAHLYASDPRKKVYMGDKYLNNPFLLKMAQNMANKLLPAYLTETGLPYPRINLSTGINGIPEDLITENNVAGMASPMFEFTLLSYLTGDSKYALVTRYAFDKLWATRTDWDLIYSSVNPQDGSIREMMTGIGASVDSFYEYALKGSILFDDQDLYEIWVKSNNALKLFSKKDWFYINIFANNGHLATGWIDSLSAFWPGLKVLDGDLEDSISKHLLYNTLWNKFGGIPERWSFNPTPERIQKNENDNIDSDELIYGWRSKIPLEWYPLRPEFIESTYYLYRATKDPFYLNIGYQILNDLKYKFKSNCGFAGIQDIGQDLMQDRMETFVISETLKYLYLLFDENNEIHHTRDNIIFSTEAHPMWLSKEMKQWYDTNKYFNDTKYMYHLRRCHKFDNHIKKLDQGQFEYKYLTFKQRDEDVTEMTPPIVGQCPYNRMNLWNMKNDGYKLPYSNILSGMPNLFEMETRYAISFPESPKRVQQMELDPLFYDQWYDPQQSQSGRVTTTESFELTISFEREYLPPVINDNIHDGVTNGKRIIFHHLFGGKRLRLEKLRVNEIDTYGAIVGTKWLSNIDTYNMANPKQHCEDNKKQKQEEEEEDKILPMVYRVTVVDGITLNSNDTIWLNGTEIKRQIKEESSSPSSPMAPFSFFRNHKPAMDEFQLGYNRHNQLMFGCIPVLNVFLTPI